MQLDLHESYKQPGPTADNFLIQQPQEERHRQYQDNSIGAQLELISEVEEQSVNIKELGDIEEERDVLEELKVSEIDDGFLEIKDDSRDAD